jgi:hypothetical protein
MGDNEKKGFNIWVWIFRLLVVAGGGGMLYTWLRPWWTIDAESFGPDLVQIHPWGLGLNERLGDFVIFLKGSELPGWFAAFMWAYLVICMIALLVALWVRSGVKVGFGKIKIELNKLLIGGVGASYIIVGAVAAIFASMRVKALMNIPLLGRSWLDMGGEFQTFVESRFLTAYYLVYVVGLFLIILALIRDIILEDE